MDISNLKKIWNADKEAFRDKEIGGLQDFVKEILQSEDILNLKKGLESTHLFVRNKEFTIETSKENRRADFVIYIDKDIVIPVEVEKHNNIEKGKEQLFQYQRDWDKKYGILTDGNEWRLYKSTIYKSFYIEDILNNPESFLAYFNDYIKPENYYLEMFNPKGQESLFKADKLDLNIAKNRQLFFDDVTQVIQKFKSKIIVVEDKLWQTDEKIVIETSYAYLIQFILYKVLVDNNYKKFNQEYGETLRKIQKSLIDEDYYSLIIFEIRNISEYVANNLYTPFQKEQESINKRLAKNLKDNLNIHDIAPWLDMILFIDKYNFAGLKNEVFGFIYENFLKDLYNKNNKGQFFTDPAVVNFMLQEMGYTTETIQKNPQQTSIIDPSCGAGTFLYSAVDRIVEALDNGTKEKSKKIEELVNKNVFGLDIEEFPLFLAEMNILMRMLPLIVNESYENPIENKLNIFKTKDSISEFLGIGLTNSNEQLNLMDSIKETALDYPSFMRDEKDLEEMLKSLKEVAGVRERFDYVVGNPPYVGLNKCYESDAIFTTHMRHINKDGSINKNKKLFMNDVYGVNLHSIPKKAKKGRPNPNLYAFFIALGLALLKENGTLSYIIPQTILVDTDYDVLRYHLSYFTTIEKIITFEGKLFIGRGLKQNKPVATSSLIFVVKKEKPSKNHKVKIVNYAPYLEKDGIDFEEYIKKGKKKEKNILQEELSNNLDSWNYIRINNSVELDFIRYYQKNSESIRSYYDHKLSSVFSKEKFYFDGGYSIDEKKIKEEKGDYIYPKVDNNLFTIKRIKGYWRDEREDINNDNHIGLRQGNQKYKLLDSKYKIIWSYANTNKFFFTDKSVIWARNQFNAIGSDNRKEILYILSILNSAFSSRILHSIFKLNNEDKLTIALGIKSIKNIINIPKITKENEFIKEEIIEKTNWLLKLEDYQLKDFVKFDTQLQKFKDVEVIEDKLVLTDLEGNQQSQQITSKLEFVKSFIEEKFHNKESLGIVGKDINLQDLKYMEAIDKKEQEILKSYIDDLVFSLYFNIPIQKVDLKDPIKLKELCMKNEFYHYINQEN